MYEFLSNNRAELTARCRAKVALRPGRSASTEQLENGVPMFLEQLIRTLLIEQSSTPSNSVAVSGPAGGVPATSEMGSTAARHGKALLALGFTVDQVVHDYGDLCQAITDLAIERDAPFQIEEFRTLNRCLDNAIADAVTEFSYQRDSVNADKQSSDSNEQLSAFISEIRNHVGAISLAFCAAKAGNLAVTGATGTILERNILKLDRLIDEAWLDIRVSDDHAAVLQTFFLRDFISEAQAAVQLYAARKGGLLMVDAVDVDLAISGLREVLLSALVNLLQHAFNFTETHTKITLTAYASSDRILIEVSHKGGRLEHGAAEAMFLPFSQTDKSRTGFGADLAISRVALEAHDGSLSVRELPDAGCVFTINLPRHTVPT
jgi:signal transduction histidine kinase